MCDVENEKVFREDYWNTRRTQLLIWFEKHTPGLAELYKGALRNLFDKSLPARYHMVGHAAREIRNNIPDSIKGISIKKVHYEQRVDLIIKQFSKNSFNILNNEIPAADSSTIAIPIDVFKEIKSLCNDRAKSKDAGKRKIVDFFMNIAEENMELKPVFLKMIEDWYRETERFFKYAHINSINKQEYDESELIRVFDIFENGLFSILGEYFETKGELSEFLAEANRRTD